MTNDIAVMISVKIKIILQLNESIIKSLYVGPKEGAKLRIMAENHIHNPNFSVGILENMILNISGIAKLADTP